MKHQRLPYQRQLASVDRCMFEDCDMNCFMMFMSLFPRLNVRRHNLNLYDMYEKIVCVKNANSLC